MVKVTDEMILKWEKIVQYVYKTFYSKYFSHLKDDLLQNGRLGIFSAYQTYVDEKTNKCALSTHIKYRVKGYMGHLIRHEMRHETQTTTEYDLDTIENEDPLSLLSIDIETALNTLSEKERECVLKFSNGNNFRHMDCNRETARVRFNKALKKLKRRLIV